MNPKRCIKCLLHGTNVAMHGSQECPRTDCACRKCSLVDSRRDVANKIVKLSRKQKAKQDMQDCDNRYMCARCRNHGVRASKKHHIPCPFQACECESCILNSERRRIEREMRDAYRKDYSKESSPSTSDSDSEKSDCNELTPEAKVILDLINALSSESFDPEKFDYDALSDFFSKPFIRLPDAWLPHMSDINDLVLVSLKRFPRFDGIDFSRGLNQAMLVQQCAPDGHYHA